jgi:hypothetical protein
VKKEVKRLSRYLQFSVWRDGRVKELVKEFW